MIDDGVAELSDESSNPNTCESDVIVNIFADEPSNPSVPSVPSCPSVPCLAFVKLISLLKLTSPEAPLADTAVIINEPLSCPIEVTVTVFELTDELTDVVDVALIE